MKNENDINYFEWFFNEFDYPQESREAVLACYDRIIGCEESGLLLKKLISDYEKDVKCNYTALINGAKELSEKCGVNFYTGVFVFLVLLTKPLKEFYRKNAIDESIWKTSVFDLKYKLLKCKNLYGVWGTVDAEWFFGFFNLTRFGFEKLQFEVVDFVHTYEIGGLSLKPDSKVINIHIPRTGQPLDKESRVRAYGRAKEFFKLFYDEDKTPFVCHTWLLFPENREFLSPASNLISFMNEFEVIDVEYYEDYSQTWRIFDTLDYSDIDKLPQKTSLQRGYAEMMRRGERTGVGYGIFVL